MDRITKSYVGAFQFEQSLAADVEESTLFELFADYCVVTDEYDEEFDVDADVHVGGENDLGLDGVAIIVNGALVTAVEEAEDLLAVNNHLDVKFVLVQAKTTSGFSGEQMAGFLDGVDEFFEEDPTLPMADELQNLHDIMTWIYKNSVKFRRQKPTLHLAYVTTGQWKNDAHLQAKIDKRVEQLRDTGLFGEIAFVPFGADELHASYQRSKNSVVAEFTFVNKVLLPDIDGVSESYLACFLLPSSCRWSQTTLGTCGSLSFTTIFVTFRTTTRSIMRSERLFRTSIARADSLCSTTVSPSLDGRCRRLEIGSH